MDGKSKTALITGASGGVDQLAKLFARDHYNLVLVARSADKLNQVAGELQGQFGVTVKTIALDLAAGPAGKSLFDQVQGEGVVVDVLVNNAGFGVLGEFAGMEEEEILGQIQLNITALTQLTRSFLPSMVARRSGKIMNVASTAAFQPGPLMAVYYATKAYVLSFSEALANEVAGSGVVVSCFCPGATDTGFQKRAGITAFPSVQENRGDERGSCSAGWISRVDGGKDDDFRRAKLAGGGIGEICTEEIGDGNFEVGSGEGGIGRMSLFFRHAVIAQGGHWISAIRRSAIAVLVMAASLTPGKPTRGSVNDFIAYWTAAYEVIGGHNPYAAGPVLALERQLGFAQPKPLIMRNPPWAVPVIVLFGLLPFGVAQELWLVGNLIAVLIAMRWLWASIKQGESRVGLRGWPQQHFCPSPWPRRLDR